MYRIPVLTTHVTSIRALFCYKQRKRNDEPVWFSELAQDEIVAAAHQLRELSVLGAACALTYFKKFCIATFA